MKKNILFIAGIISAILLGINQVGVYKMCSNMFECTELLSKSVLILFPIIPLFLFSLITYKMREEIFQSWWRFARIWIPISMVTILLAPSYTHNWMFPITKGSVAFFLSGIFIVVSLVKIVLEWMKSKK